MDIVTVFIYHSELTHRTIITLADKGKTWEMEDGEVYDQVKACAMHESNLIMIDENGESTYGLIADLA